MYFCAKELKIMTRQGLSGFVKELEADNELIRISEEISPILEITEIYDRIVKNAGKALLFENTGTKFPVLINAFGSEKRICKALDISDLDEPGERINKIIQNITKSSKTFKEQIATLQLLKELNSFMPKKKKGLGACQQVVIENPDLNNFPILKCWTHDAERFITLPIVHTQHPETGMRNVGMYRMQVISENQTAMHWHVHKNSASHFMEYKRLNKKMPVSVVLGGHPVYTYAATAPLPKDIDEYLLAGFLRKKKVELVKCITNDIYVPEDADIVIEGYINPEEEFFYEGPFGDHTGFYSLEDFYPKFHITHITHRKNAIYPATVVGIPPQEDLWLGKATEKIFSPLIKLTLSPEIEDIYMPMEGVFHNIVLAKIRKSYPGQVSKTMNTIWGAGQMMFTKIIVLLDENVNLESGNILKTIVENVNPLRDLTFTTGPADALEHASQEFLKGSKIGIDATQKDERQEFDFESITSFSEKLIDNDFLVNMSLVNQKIPVLIVGIDKKNKKNQLLKINETLPQSAIPYILLLDSKAINLPLSDILWLTAANIDPIRDCRFYSENNNQSLPLTIDATSKTLSNDNFKRRWPNAVVMSDDIIKKVDEKWGKLGLGEFLESPSKKYKVLVENQGAEVAD